MVDHYKVDMIQAEIDKAMSDLNHFQGQENYDEIFARLWAKINKLHSEKHAAKHDAEEHHEEELERLEENEYDTLSYGKHLGNWFSEPLKLKLSELLKSHHEVVSNIFEGVGFTATEAMSLAEYEVMHATEIINEVFSSEESNRILSENSKYGLTKLELAELIRNEADALLAQRQYMLAQEACKENGFCSADTGEPSIEESKMFIENLDEPTKLAMQEHVLLMLEARKNAFEIYNQEEGVNSVKENLITAHKNFYIDMYGPEDGEALYYANLVMSSEGMSHDDFNKMLMDKSGIDLSNLNEETITKLKIEFGKTIINDVERAENLEVSYANDQLLSSNGYTILLNKFQDSNLATEVQNELYRIFEKAKRARESEGNVDGQSAEFTSVVVTSEDMDSNIEDRGGATIVETRPDGSPDYERIVNYESSKSEGNNHSLTNFVKQQENVLEK